MRMRPGLWTTPMLFALVAMMVSGCGGRGVDTAILPAPLQPICSGYAAPVPRTFIYRDDSSVEATFRSLDVYNPARDRACPPAATVVYFHGGGYVTGDKSQQVANKVALAASEGWVFASVNYRLSPNPAALDDQNRVRYPDAQNDAADAVRWLFDHATSLGLDPRRVVLMGHSAGGHIVSLLSSDPQFLARRGLGLSTLRCGVSLDSEGYDIETLVRQGGDDNLLYQNAIGTDAATQRAASPLVQARTGMPAQFIVTRGSVMRQRQAQDYVDRLIALAVPSSLLVADGYSHADVNAAVGRPGEGLITPPLLEFLLACTN